MAINTGVNISKAVAYAVLQAVPGVDIAKAVAYAALRPVPGVDIAKAVAYAALAPAAGVDIAKAVVYAARAPVPGVDIAKAVVYAVVLNSGAPIWPPLNPPIGTVGVPYSFSFNTAGTSPTTFTVASGSLPPGLVLSNVSGNTGKIAGTPTLAGSYSFTLLATNPVGSAPEPATIIITPEISQRGNIDYDQIRASVRHASGSQFQMFGGGTVTAGDIAVFDASGNVVDGGPPATGGSGGTEMLEVPAGTMDGTNTVFALSHTPLSNSLALYLNGVEQIPSTDFTITGTAITYIVPPVSDDLQEAQYSY